MSIWKKIPVTNPSHEPKIWAVDAYLPHLVGTFDSSGTYSLVGVGAVQSTQNVAGASRANTARACSDGCDWTLSAT